MLQSEGSPALAETYLNRLPLNKPEAQNTKAAGKHNRTPLFTDHRFHETGHMHLKFF
jgi:hypothetical protein